MIDTIKITIVAIVGGIYSYFEPVHNPIKVLAIVFTADILAGILVDLIVNNDRIQIRKFLLAVAFLALYSVIIASVFVIGKLMGDMVEALVIVKSLTYVFTAFYVSNFFRNMKKLAPNSKPIAFLAYIFGLHVVKKLPELAKWMGLTPNKTEEHEAN